MTHSSGLPDTSLTNVAIGKSSTQSSRAPSAATSAMKGTPSGSYGFHTGPDASPWWTLDLHEPYAVDFISIFNRQDCCEDRARAISLSISEDGDDWAPLLTTQTLCFGGAREGSPLTLWLGGRHRLRYLRVESLASNTPLHLDEVQVWVRTSSLAASTLSSRIGGHLREGGWEWGRSPKGYELHNVDPAKLTAARSPVRFGIKSLALRASGRFGNQVMQLQNAVATAITSGATTIYLGEVNPLYVGQAVTVQGVTFVPGALPDFADATLEGTFFNRSDLGDLASDLPSKRLAIVSDYLEPLFQPYLASITPADVSVLHCHIRSGDLFRGDVHPGYPQPPVAYYQNAVLHAQSSLEIVQVVVVYEDDANPTVGALTKWLRVRGIRYRVQSANLQSDLSELLSARHLVASYGTFCDNIALLSPNLLHYYAFRPVRYVSELTSRGVAHVGVTDDPASPYIAVGAWHNTSEQRALMLSYDPASLRMGSGIAESRPDRIAPPVAGAPPEAVDRQRRLASLRDSLKRRR